MKYAIVNADDFGLSPGVNQGILESYQAGSVTSTTLMVNMPGFEDAVRLAREYPGLGVGLHFNLTYGRPVSAPYLVPSLVDMQGRFYSAKVRVYRDPRDIETELDAQWNRMIGTGLFPTHLDSHHHMHQSDDGVYRVMTAFAARKQVPMRRSQLPVPQDAAVPMMTDAVLLDTYGDTDALPRLLHYVQTVPEGVTELMCHPGYVDDTVRAISEWTDIRERELAVFTLPDISRCANEHDVTLIHYGQLPAARARLTYIEQEASQTAVDQLPENTVIETPPISKNPTGRAAPSSKKRRKTGKPVLRRRRSLRQRPPRRRKRRASAQSR